MITIDKDGWIKEAIGIYYPNRSWGAFIQKPRQIVLHGTATANATAQDIANNWANTDGDASAHIIINKDGSFVQGLSLNATAWANCCLTDNPNTGALWARQLPLGNQNYWSIAIEHCKYDPNYNSDVLTPEQQVTSFALVKAICEYHGIPKQVIGIGDISNGGIIGHCNIDQLNRTYCPGPYSWQALSDYLQGGAAPMTPGTPRGWSDDGKTLKGPNGVPVVKGFRDYILANAWDPGNWPLQPEEGRNPLELSNPALGAGTQQIFRLSALEWTPTRGAFVAWIGQELLALRKENHG